MPLRTFLLLSRNPEYPEAKCFSQRKTVACNGAGERHAGSLDSGTPIFEAHFHNDQKSTFDKVRYYVIFEAVYESDVKLIVLDTENKLIETLDFFPLIHVLS